MAKVKPPVYVPEFDPALHEYRWEGKIFIGATTLLTKTGIRLVPSVDPVTLELARVRGTIVHQATVGVDEGVAVPVDPAFAGYMQAYAMFCGTSTFLPVPDWTEQPLCDPALGVAGTPDRVGYYGPHLKGAVLDIKTGEQEPSIGVQLAIYRHLLAVNGFPTVHRLSLHLRDDGTFRLYEYTDAGDHAAFLAALAIYRWRQKAQAA